MGGRGGMYSPPCGVGSKRSCIPLCDTRTCDGLIPVAAADEHFPPVWRQRDVSGLPERPVWRQRDVSDPCWGLAALALFEQLRRPQLHLVDPALQEGGAHEVAEQRVRPVRSRAELRMELAGHEPRVAGQLDDLDQARVRRHPAEDQAGVTEHLTVLVVELEAVAVSLVHDLLPVRGMRERARQQLAGI